MSENAKVSEWLDFPGRLPQGTGLSAAGLRMLQKFANMGAVAASLQRAEPPGIPDADLDAWETEALASGDTRTVTLISEIRRLEGELDAAYEY